MTEGEAAVVVRCNGEQLTGVFHPSLDSQSQVGVLIVVGGPQYRVGSHRHFVTLARFLADFGIPAFRFDCRGMGDSTGVSPGFASIDDDISAAVHEFQKQVPSMKRVVLWGLCDGASAVALYCRHRSMVGGVVLVNPWVRSEQGLARTHVKRHYAERFRSRQFWGRLVRGDVNIFRRLDEFVGTIRSLLLSDSPGSNEGGYFQERMAAALGIFGGDVLIILSGDDLTAAEFVEYKNASPAWQDALAKCNTTIKDIPEADHTFSAKADSDCVSVLTRDWVLQL